MASEGNQQWPALTAVSGSASGTSVMGVGSSNLMNDPFYLSQSDHPGMILVSHPLTGDNYISWKRSIMLALSSKLKLGFINGKVVPPKDTDASFDQWKRVDDLVITWILNCVSRDIVNSIIFANTAKELWDDLAQRFGESNGPLVQ